MPRSLNTVQYVLAVFITRKPVKIYTQNPKKVSDGRHKSKHQTSQVLISCQERPIWNLPAGATAAVLHQRVFLTQEITNNTLSLQNLSSHIFTNVITTLLAFVSHQSKPGYPWVELHENVLLLLNRIKTRPNIILQRGREDTGLNCDTSFQSISNCQDGKDRPCGKPGLWNPVRRYSQVAVSSSCYHSVSGFHFSEHPQEVNQK